MLENTQTGGIIRQFPLEAGDGFAVTFIHSVNKSPVSDFYEVREDGIYVVKTVYYGFGAGVQTELGEGQVLTYGEDGSMIITGFDLRMNDLIYAVGTVSDHVLALCRKTEETGFFAPDTVPPVWIDEEAGADAGAAEETRDDQTGEETVGAEETDSLETGEETAGTEKTADSGSAEETTGAIEYVSLRELCGRNTKVRFRYVPLSGDAKATGITKG